MLIDTHCHLEENEYDNLDNMIGEIFNTDVKIIIVSGYDVKSSINAIKFAHKYDNIYATVGFHPTDCMADNAEDYKLFDEWLNDNKVVGIGEIGLDYYYDIEHKEVQIERFEKQVKIAEKYNKPIVVHCREAYEDIYSILKNSNVKGIIHCFSGDYEIAEKFIGLGFMLGVGGILTFKNSKLKDVIEKVPLNNIVLETDSPYLTPEPYRGTKNSPKNIPLIALALAKIKNVTYNEVASITTSNATRVFDFKRDL